MLKKIIFIFLTLAIGGCGDKTKSTSNEPDSSLSTSSVLDRYAYSFDVTDKFGSLTFDTGEFKYDSEMRPWSSWWFPSIDRELFIDENSSAPLEKYDEYVLLKHNEVVESAYFEDSNLFNAIQAPWAGLCHAWAVASLLHREPSRQITKEGMSFSTGDQKALLLKSYENVSNLEIYGQRYDGLFGNDFEDIYPDQFHRFLQIHLRDEKKAFIMDYDSSYPVWTVPVYKSKSSIVKKDSNTVSVKTWVTYASPFVEKSFVGTRQVVKTYTYDLFGSWKNGVFNVSDSEWTETSIHDHPDYVISFPQAAIRGSYNTEMKVDLVDEILKY
jgi:hypothetical protein